MHAKCMDSTKPIGYWLKRLDELIETNLDHALEPFGLQRRHWQTLNLVAAGDRRSGDVAAELAPFLESSDRAESLLNELIDTGWLQRTDDLFDFTDSGRSRFETAHSAVTTARTRVGEGLSRRDYETTVATLQIMCQNLERAQQ